MAFYKDFERKTRSEKQKDAFARGGYDEEGSRSRSKGTRGNQHSEERSSQRDGRSYAKSNDQRGKRPEQRSSRDNDRYGDRTQQRGGAGRTQQSRGYDKKQTRNFRDDSRGNRRDSFDSRRPQEQHFDKEYERYRYQPATPAPAAVEPPREEENLEAYLLSGRNPIREALKNGRDIEKLMVVKGELSGSAREIVQMAREARVPVQEVERVRLDAITRNHQGMLAFASAYQYATVQDMLDLAEERGEAPFLVILDGITDPHNLGAIIRSAECAGAHGVIVQERRAVGLTPAAVKASAGAVEYLPVARVTNLANTIEMLQKKNIWVYAADMAGDDYTSVNLSGAVALVIGAEGEGVGHRVLEMCDGALSLPLCGKVDSLNASVAAGILMYAVLKSRR